jgi:DDE_Tnp_1-associated
MFAEKTMSDILSHLSKIPDHRRKEGIRYPLDKTLVLMLLGTMSGCIGYRSVARFCKVHEKYLSKMLGLKHGVPSHVSLTAIIENVDLAAFERALSAWGSSKLKSNDKVPPVIAIDGKSIKASVTSGISDQQNFIAIVHAFCVSQELVISSLSYENKHISETEIVRQMVEMLGIQGVIYTLDAAHALKKQ